MAIQNNFLEKEVPAFGKTVDYIAAVFGKKGVRDLPRFFFRLAGICKDPFVESSAEKGEAHMPKMPYSFRLYRYTLLYKVFRSHRDNAV